MVNFIVWLIFATKMQKFAPDVLKIVVWEFEHRVLSRCRAFGIEPIISSKAQIASYENVSLNVYHTFPLPVPSLLNLCL